MPIPASTFASRRAELLERMGPGSVAVFPSSPVHIRNNDVEHAYRQDSDLWYLTGFEEPDTVLVLTTAHDEHRAVLFVRERNPERETWDGPRAGVEGAVERFGADAAFPIGDLTKKLQEYFAGASRLHYAVGRGHPLDAKVFEAMRVARQQSRKTGKAYPTELVDPVASVHEMRLRKSPEEIEVMKRAAKVTAAAHVHAMEYARPGQHEYEVEAEMGRVFRQKGSERSAYDSIVGSGPNATILHYRANRRRMEEGDLLLIDAGCEYDYYASDVTRTFPVGGRFTEPAKAIYEIVLRAELAAVDSVKPGVTLDEIHATAAKVVTEGLITLGLVEGPLDEAMEEERYKPFFMHKTSHWIGMDVHDVGAYHVDGSARPLEPGFVLTVEPGIYIAPDAEVDAKWRGIGVRIEDDILVTADGHENLTAAIPKSVEDIEALTAGRHAVAS